MTILWDKKLIRFSDGSYIAWGLKRKKFFFANKNELKLNCAIIEYYEEREKCDKKVISDLNKIIAELKKENAELKAINEGYCRSRDRLASIGLPTFMSGKKCKYTAPNGQEHECKLSISCTDCEYRPLDSALFKYDGHEYEAIKDGIKYKSTDGENWVPETEDFLKENK